MPFHLASVPQYGTPGPRSRNPSGKSRVLLPIELASHTFVCASTFVSNAAVSWQNLLAIAGEGIEPSQDGGYEPPALPLRYPALWSVPDSNR